MSDSPFSDSFISEEADSTLRDVVTGERMRQRLAKDLVHLPNGHICISHEADCRHWFDQLEHLAWLIVNSELPPFFEPTKAKDRRRAGTNYRKSELTQQIWMLCTQGVPVIEGRFPGCRPRSHTLDGVAPMREDGPRVRFNPYTWLTLRACQRAAHEFNLHKELHTPYLSHQGIREAMLRLVATVRKVGRSKRFHRLDAKRIRNHNERLRSCCHYVATRFAMYSCLLFGRVDLYIRPSHRDWGNSDEVEKHLRLFLRALTEDRILPDVKAWICKRENGPDRGIHYHLLYALDGHKHREAASYSKILGEAWLKRVNKERGSYFNCSVKANEYTYNALGLVRVGDRLKLYGIREAIRYMVKGDAYILTGRQRNLWRGVTGKSWSAIKRGAPRKPEHDMTLVEEILGSF
jgi:hypothetical protein